LQQWADWEISASLLFVAAALFRLSLSENGLRKHYVVPASACALFAFWIPTHAHSDAMRIARDLLIGITLIVGGVGDDRVLRRVLHQCDSHDDVPAI
jgi:tRNA A37 threonylcarbamoyltransferase TsaD